MEAAGIFDWGTVAVFDCLIDWPQGRGSHLAGFLAQFIHRPWMEGERNEGRASKAAEELCTVLRINTEETEVGDDERVPPVSGRKRRKQGGLAATSRFT